MRLGGEARERGASSAAVTVSFDLMKSEKLHFIYPFVPRGSRTWPVRPFLVCSSTGLNHLMSSGR